MAANDFQAKYLELVVNDPYIRSVARPGQAIVGLETYVYNGLIGATAPLSLANGALQSTIDTHADSDFVLTYLSACVNVTNNINMVWNRNITLQIQDTSTGKLFFNQPTVMLLCTGTGGFPFVFPAPRVIKANTSLLLTAQNRDTAQDYGTMFVALGGTRIFYQGLNNAK